MNALTYFNEGHHNYPVNVPRDTDDIFKVTGPDIKVNSDSHGNVVNSLAVELLNTFETKLAKIHLAINHELAGF